MVTAAVESVPPFEHTDATFIANAPPLSATEPALVFVRVPRRRLRATTRQDDSANWVNWSPSRHRAPAATSSTRRGEPEHLITLLEDQALGIAFISLGEGIDATTPAGKLQMHILGAIAEFERGLIVERVRAGLARAKALGKRLGRHPYAISPTRSSRRSPIARCGMPRGRAPVAAVT
jgi:hypothetical protein